MSAAADASGAILAVDLGGTRLRVAALSMDGTELFKRAIATPRERPEALVEAMREAVREASTPIAFAVVGVAGFVVYRTGEMARMPNLPAWERAITAPGLAVELQLPVVLVNDADLAALGEHRYGAGRGVDDMAYLTASTGVGAGVVLGGRLLHGHRSLAEIGHTILDPKTGETVEDRGSGTALARLAGEDAARVTERARAGDPLAVEQLRVTADAVAVGVYNLSFCFMPERVVLGGGLARAGELLLGPVRERIARAQGCSVGPDDIVLAEGGDDVGLLGALALGRDLVEGAGTAASLPVFGL